MIPTANVLELADGKQPCGYCKRALPPMSETIPQWIHMLGEAAPVGVVVNCPRCGYINTFDLRVPQEEENSG